MQADHFPDDDPFLPRHCIRRHQVMTAPGGLVHVPPGMVVRECPDCGRLAVLPPEDDESGWPWLTVAALFVLALLLWWGVTIAVLKLTGVR